MLDQAFDALKTYEWGVDPSVLQPIDDAIIANHGNAAASKELEIRLAAVLKTEAPHAAKDAVCRALRICGTSHSVPSLAPLLGDEKLSHMARYALERMPHEQAGQALLAALAKVPGKLKIGIIATLGVRGEDASVAPLQVLLKDGDAAIAQAAAHALGSIGTYPAAKALVTAKTTAATKDAIADASMACAEKLLAAGNKAAAKTTYQQLLGSSPSKSVEFAAKRGLQACAG